MSVRAQPGFACDDRGHGIAIDRFDGKLSTMDRVTLLFPAHAARETDKPVEREH